MNLVTPNTISLFKTVWHYGSAGALCFFGTRDCIRAVKEKNLHLAMRVAYLARGVFLMTAGVLSLCNVPFRYPFMAAHSIGVGIHASIWLKDPGKTIPCALGMISSLGYVIFSLSRYPIMFAVAFVTGSTYLLLETRVV